MEYPKGIFIKVARCFSVSSFSESELMKQLVVRTYLNETIGQFSIDIKCNQQSNLDFYIQLEMKMERFLCKYLFQGNRIKVFGARQTFYVHIICRSNLCSLHFLEFTISIFVLPFWLLKLCLFRMIFQQFLYPFYKKIGLLIFFFLYLLLDFFNVIHVMGYSLLSDYRSVLIPFLKVFFQH